MISGIGSMRRHFCPPGHHRIKPVMRYQSLVILQSRLPPAWLQQPYRKCTRCRQQFALTFAESQ